MDETQAPVGGMPPGKSGSPVMSIIIVVIILALGAFFMLRDRNDDVVEQTGDTVEELNQEAGELGTEIENTTATTTPEVSPTTVATTTPATTGTTATAVKEFTVTGKNFSFEPKTLSVNKGDKVKITFKNADGFHDLVIDELGVKTKQISGGAQEVVEFTATKSGSFQYYCSVGQHRANGMVGTLTVK